MSNIITIISDFGLQDPFVGIMKGVMLGIAPQLRFIDLTHQVPPQDLYHTFFALQSAYSYFPKGTVHLVVVDPGVGGTRRAIAIESDGHYFVGPDNGVFSFLYNKKNLPCRVIELNHEKYFLETVSQTFQGRDLFAPVAACLAKGHPFNSLGKRVKNPIHLPIEEPVVTGKRITGEVIYIDRFGNLATNITKELLSQLGGHLFLNKTLTFSVKKVQGNIYETYSSVPKGEFGATVNSWGVLEVYVNCGSAVEISGALSGTPLEVTLC